MTTQAKLWTVNSIQEANRAKGGHWFDPDTMRAFGTKVLPEVYQGPGGVFFVTQDKAYDGSRGYTVRDFDPETGDVGTADGTKLCDYTARGAKLKARSLATQGGKLSTIETTRELHRPVTILEQFLSDCRKHGNPNASQDDAQRLTGRIDSIGLAARHHKYMEAQCNGEWPYAKHDGEEEPTVVRQCREEIRKIAETLGASGVIFSGDPRGCTVKLTFPDGFTNDFAGEGYCVPTSLKSDE